MATLQYVAVLAAGALLVTAVAVVPMAGPLARMVYCAVQSVKSAPTGFAFTCSEPEPGSPGTGNPGSQSPGTTPPSGSPTPGQPPQDCNDAVYFPYDQVPPSQKSVVQTKGVGGAAEGPVERAVDTDNDPQVARIGCSWYYIPTDCGAPPAGWQSGLTPDSGVDIKPYEDCITGGRGKPDPTSSDDPSCVNTMPDGLDPGAAKDARVQIGCVVYVVPQECSSQWNSYTSADDAADHRHGAADTVSAGVDLAKCVLTTYNKLDNDCTVWSKGTSTTTTTQILFWKWSKTAGLVVEKLGDGRYRVTIAHGESNGNGVQFSLSAGAGKAKGSVDMGVWAMSGADDTDQYDFPDEDSAQRWIDWYAKYQDADQKVAKIDNDKGCYSKHDCTHATDNSPSCTRFGMCNNEAGQFAADERTLKQLQDSEPPHHSKSTGTSTSDKTEFSLGGSVDVGGGASAGLSYDYSSESKVATSNGTDGSYSASWSDSSINGLAAFIKFGMASPDLLEDSSEDDKSGDKGEDGKKGGGGKGKGSLKLAGGGEWQGTSTITPTWGADGNLASITFRMDSAALATMKEEEGAGIELGAFGVDFSHVDTQQSGTVTVVESKIDFSLHPELRGQYEKLVDASFPGGKDRKLQSDKVNFAGDENKQQLTDLENAAKKGATRTLTYDADITSDENSVGAPLFGLKLASEKWTKTTDERNLDSSNLTLTDVYGNQQTVDPAPKCYLPPFQQPTGWLSNDYSNPSTASHPAGQGYDLGRSRTPL